MSDSMRGGAIPKTAGGQGALNAMRANASVFNPVDAAAMKSPGHPMYIDPNKTTVRQYLEMNGMNLDGPVGPEFTKFAQSQASKANPINKMVGIGQAGMDQGARVPGGQATPPAQTGGSAASSGSLESLMQELGGTQ